MNFPVPKTINNALITLQNAGFEAFVVGGCVRDTLLGKTPQDYDITTSATPEQVMSLFPHTIPTGIKHGTVTVVFENNEKTEITTFRTEGSYNDNRHPEDVTFVKTIEEDLSRRDFTVNAMAFCENTGLKDPFGGLTDLNNKILRAVGNPELRFKEDALRILRLFRFSAQLNFEIERKTFDCAIKLAKNLRTISRERIREEFIKTLCGQNPAAITPLIETDCLSFLEIGEKFCDFSELTLLEASPVPRFSMFCFKNGQDSSKIAQNLRFSKAFAKSCENVCALLKGDLPAQKVQIKQILKTTPKSDFEIYLNILSCFTNTDLLWSNLEAIHTNNEPYRLSHLKINGDDLLKLGFKDKQIKTVLENLLNLVIENPELNTEEHLKRQVTK